MVSSGSPTGVSIPARPDSLRDEPQIFSVLLFEVPAMNTAQNRSHSVSIRRLGQALLLSTACLAFAALPASAQDPKPAQDKETAKAAIPVPVKAAASASPQIDGAKAKKGKNNKAQKNKVAKALPVAGNDTCAGGVLFDDGTTEGGVGYHSGLNLGMVVQRFDSPKLSGKAVDKVCACLFSNRAEAVDFEVVFFEEQGGQPAAKPYASVAARATDLPQKMAESGRFYSVDVSDVTLPEGPSYVGVRWDPSKAHRTFTCIDKTEKEGQAPIQGFHRDNISRGWEDLLKSKDFYFKGHQSAMIRVQPKKDAKADK